MNLINFNKHWEKDFFYNFKIKRVYFDSLVKKLDYKFINLLIWLRRVWKTTLIFQLINYLIENWTSRDNILYYSFDNWWDIEDIINDYQKFSNKDIIKDKIFIFLDEIQNVENWQNKIKIYYDLYPNIKIILSWSSSVFLKSTESLAWRIVIDIIKPLFFEEYLEYKNKLYYLEKPKLYWDKLVLEFEKYLYRQFFDIIDFNLLEAKEYIKDLKNKIIKEDAKKYFNIKYPDILLKIFDIISLSPWMTIDYNNLWNDLNIDSRTIQTYIYFLEESFLVSKVYNYSPNLLTSEKKQKKLYLKSTSFFNWNWEITWELFENYIQNYFDYRFFYRFNKHEVDFIDIVDNKVVRAVEVKYKSKMKKDFIKWLDFFQKKFAIDKKTIISKDIETQFWDVEVIPFWKIASLNENKS